MALSKSKLFGFSKIIMALGMCGVMPCVTHAETNGPMVPDSGKMGDFYYQLGGGSNVPMPAFLDTQSVPLSVSGNVGLGYNCGVFNPQLSIENAMNGIKNSAINMEQGIINNATGAIYDMPLYIIARANHTAYDILTNQFFNAQSQLEVSTKSCQVMQQEMSNGQNPYSNWASIAMEDDWEKHMSASFSSQQLGASESQDINQVKQTVDQDNGDNGIPWVFGAGPNNNGSNAGGEGQEPIQVIHDTVIAGYNVLLQSGRYYDDQSAPGEDSKNAYLVGIWTSPVEAASWIVNVVGDQEITTFSEGEKKSTPGVGLLPDVYEETQEVQTQLVNLVEGTTSITVQNLQALASPSMVLNKEAIQAFQNLGSVDQAIYVHKLAQAIAAERIAEKVRIAKQLLTQGEHVPQIYSNKAARIEIENALQELDDDRHSMTFNESSIFGSASALVQAVMTMTQATEQENSGIQPSPSGSQPLENGALPIQAQGNQS